jgi:ABC-type protease/lipase transport system fused ATPase/permease subunit
VLDEPNAHLDAEGEEALNAALKRLKQAKATVIIVSQRTGVLQSVDRVLMMREGQIVGSQSRDETLARISRPAGPRSAQA